MRTVLGRHVILFAEVLDLARDPHRQAGRIEAGDGPYAADALARGAPEGFGSDAVGADRPYSGDDNATRHIELSGAVLDQAEPAGDSVSIRGFLTCKGTSCRGESIGGNRSGPCRAC